MVQSRDQTVHLMVVPPAFMTTLFIILSGSISHDVQVWLL